MRAASQPARTGPRHRGGGQPGLTENEIWSMHRTTSPRAGVDRDPSLSSGPAQSLVPGKLGPDIEDGDLSAWIPT